MGADSTLLEQPFLDLSVRVPLRPGEPRFLGPAFHPDYATNGRFYVDFNDLFTNNNVSVTRFRLAVDHPNRVDPTTEWRLLRLEQPFPSHNCGTIRLGRDGYLYAAVGDGGWQSIGSD